MSSHRLSASGDRQYSLTAGGGQFTAMQVPSKPGDAAQVSLGSFREIALELPINAEIVVERHVLAGRSGGREVRQILVIRGRVYEGDGEVVSQRGIISTSIVAEPDEKSWPHTNLDVRKAGGPNALGFIIQQAIGRLPDVVLDVADLDPNDATPRPLTESELGSAIARFATAMGRPPKKLIVKDTAHELIARRILSSTPADDQDPEVNASPLADVVAVEVDPDIAGAWELR